MSTRFLVNLTRGAEDPDRATIAFVVANAALASGKETMVFVSNDAVRFAVPGGADGVHADGLPPLAELVAIFGEEGGALLVCTPCAKVRELDTSELVPGAAMGGGPGLVEFMTAEGAAASVSY
ncbi:MAG: DsrE family protein [Acidimicrobiales bacterium]|nr:DsrE family protein [Acidimicrobiales bacterium]